MKIENIMQQNPVAFDAYRRAKEKKHYRFFLVNLFSGTAEGFFSALRAQKAKLAQQKIYGVGFLALIDEVGDIVEEEK